MAVPESAEAGADFVDAYDKTTGIKQPVPADWLDHPVLGQNLRKTPLSEKQQRAADALAEAAGSTTDTPA